MHSKNPTREELITLCEDAIVPRNKLQSETGLKNIGVAWAILKSGFEIEEIKEIRGCYWIKFNGPWGRYYIHTRKRLTKYNGKDWYYNE